MSKFGLYDHALKAWLHHGFETVEKATEKLIEIDVKTAVVAPFNGATPSSDTDGSPAAPQEEVAVVTGNETAPARLRHLRRAGAAVAADVVA